MSGFEPIDPYAAPQSPAVPNQPHPAMPGAPGQGYSQGYGQGYGQGYSQGPGQGYGARAVPPRPPTVSLFVVLMVLGAVVTTVSTIVGFFTIDSALDEALSDPAFQDPALQDSPVDVESLAQASGRIGLALGWIVSLVLWFTFAWLVSRGHNWARIVATVLGGINLLTTVPSLFLSGSVDIALQLATILICIVGIVVLWLPQTNRWFAEVADAKRSQFYA